MLPNNEAEARVLLADLEVSNISLINCISEKRLIHPRSQNSLLTSLPTRTSSETIDSFLFTLVPKPPYLTILPYQLGPPQQCGRSESLRRYGNELGITYLIMKFNYYRKTQNFKISPPLSLFCSIFRIKSFITR